MIKLILNGRSINSREELHELLARGLEFPPYYGRNLDALFDCLTERSEETLLQLQFPEQLPDAGKLLPLLYRAAEENPHLHLETAADQG